MGSEFKYVFVREKQILDVTLIANEGVNLMMRSSRIGLVCKSDMEKAYNIDWNFKDGIWYKKEKVDFFAF